MRSAAFALFLLLTASAFGQPDSCSLCVGLVSDGTEATTVPTLVSVAESDLAAWKPASPALTTLIVQYALDPAADGRVLIEEKTRSITEWAGANGPFAGIGISVTGTDAALTAYAVKRLAITAQGLGAAETIVLPDAANLEEMFEHGANGYFDSVIVDAKNVAGTLEWLSTRDPLKKVLASVPIASPNALYDLARALADGATLSYAMTDPGRGVLEAFNRAMKGDWAADRFAEVPVLDARGAAMEMPVVSFVRGEDLRTILVPRGSADAPFIVSLAGDDWTRPRRVDGRGEAAITDSGKRGGRLLVGSPGGSTPFAIAVDRIEPPPAAITRETIDVETEKGITVEEIVRNHQAYDAWQESVQPRYIARNSTRLRFDIGGGAESFEATIAGDYFSEPGGRADWVWQDFHINGVKWKYGRIPELPLIQAEKVTQLPLDLHLTNDYRYELVRATDLRGHRVYEVRFEPPENAPAGLPLYRGTVWIDTKSWARIRISMVQLNLSGEVLSNEERVDFVAFSRASGTPVDAPEATAAPRSVIWLPFEVDAQQVISAGGRATVVQRSTLFENFRIDPPEFDALLASTSASDARMVRETPEGLRYLEKEKSGERVVKQGYDTSRLFMVGGIHHDPGLEYPVIPLGGVDYFNFNVANRGIQANVFFAGLVLAANATHPNVGNTRTNVGADFFGIAVATENAMYRDGIERPEEGVKSLPIGLNLRAGHPFLDFGKVDLSFGILHHTFQRGEETAPDFIIPSDTFTLTPGIEVRYARRGYALAASYELSRRTKWEPWGNLAEYDPAQKSYSRMAISLGKSFFLPHHQRIGVDLNYISGKNLDRFSKYELGFFGAQRVHGVESGSVHAESGFIGHLSYGFVFSEQFRIESFYDHALLDDRTSGLEGEPFQGIGIAGQTIGPYGTLLRLDVGKMIGRNAQDGFVANVVFLKLF